MKLNREIYDEVIFYKNIITIWWCSPITTVATTWFIETTRQNVEYTSMHFVSTYESFYRKFNSSKEWEKQTNNLKIFIKWEIPDYELLLCLKQTFKWLFSKQQLCYRSWCELLLMFLFEKNNISEEMIAGLFTLMFSSFFQNKPRVTKCPHFQS